mmetsp:Transcript_70515/g.147645  ORF Transcript_70515/g.147645 Transcript_70515/m.147645 type:complete len:765 (-) Transcript_70515:202-2496(-)
MSTIVKVPSNYQTIGGLKVSPTLVKLVEETVVPGTGFSSAYFFSCLETLTNELRPEVDACLKHRDDLQAKIDGFYEKCRAEGTDPMSTATRPMCRSFLKEIGYLEEDKGPVSISTQNVDDEIGNIPGPQLVVPSDNARYVLNALNSRWGSLFDALYGFDVIPQSAVQPVGESTPKSGYNPVRGEAVRQFANGLLDEVAPLNEGKWSEVTRLWPKFVGRTQQLEIQLKGGKTTSLTTPALFVGSTGSMGPPSAKASGAATSTAMPDKGRIFLKHNGLHLILEVDRADPIGAAALSGIKDITMEGPLTTILDMEDSVSAVDAEDKSKVYSNICGVFGGTLEAPFVKAGKSMVRRPNEDVHYRDINGDSASLPGRAVALVRNVGHHMFTDMAVTSDGRTIPEGFVDCLVTVSAALKDLRGTTPLLNSRKGSVYIVKPKMHGSREVALTTSIFARVEEFFGLRQNTIKVGIMDEERRTSANLRECIRAASERVFFINTGFLDRTGDEIHTCFLAGPVVRKGEMKQQDWIKAYEAANVDIGLHCGFQGKAQIGKGMWAKPDSMKAMLEAKIAEMMAGASTAWVPSPTAGCLHSIHYHRVNVVQRQMQLAMRPAAKIEMLLEPPLLKSKLDAKAIAEELKESAQSILGYVVRWIDMGVGCSKVPDLSNVGLMEDRATLRISSQLLANWMHHGLITEKQIKDSFVEMAKVVDQQNSSDKAYRPMSGNTDTNIAFQAALKLVFDGKRVPNGYTEFTLHEARRQAKSAVNSRL